MGSIVRSTGYRVLHRPVELAPFIRTWPPEAGDVAGRTSFAGKFVVSIAGEGTMRESEEQIENSGLNTEFFLHIANSH